MSEFTAPLNASSNIVSKTSYVSSRLRFATTLSLSLSIRIRFEECLRSRPSSFPSVHRSTNRHVRDTGNARSKIETITNIEKKIRRKRGRNSFVKFEHEGGSFLEERGNSAERGGLTRIRPSGYHFWEKGQGSSLGWPAAGNLDRAFPLPFSLSTLRPPSILRHAIARIECRPRPLLRSIPR